MYMQHRLWAGPATSSHQHLLYGLYSAGVQQQWCSVMRQESMLCTTAMWCHSSNISPLW